MRRRKAQNLSRVNTLKSYGIDAVDLAPSNILVDESKMCATCVAATNAIDRENDILEVSGIDTTYHQWNPVVLLDHGMTYQLPIGKTEDPDGVYSVLIGDKEVIATTYFSQHNLVSEQVFRLIGEKILRGNSVRFEREVMERIPAQEGKRSGFHIYKCDLVEVSWTALPMNQECVTSLLDLGTLGGKSLAPAIKSLLSPYKLPRKAWANGANMKNDQEEMSAVDEAHGGALRKADDVPVDQPEQEQEPEKRDEPLGASVLRDLHLDLADMVNIYEGTASNLEQPKVKAKLEKLVAGLRAAAVDVEEVFAAQYPDAEPLESVLPDQPDEESVEEEEVVEDEPEEEVVDEPKQKSYGQIKELCQKMEGQEQDKHKVLMLRAIMKEMENWQDNSVDKEVEEEESEEDMAKLKRLERAIIRREKMLSRLV